jgi:ribose 5-phosphate isomerase B
MGPEGHRVDRARASRAGISPIPTHQPVIALRYGEAVRIALGTDERTPLIGALQFFLESQGHEVLVVADSVPWPEAGGAVGRAVADGLADAGVVCCTTGTGVSMAANKVPGVRAALCTDADTARGARRWNDANVLAFGLRLTTETVAVEMVDAFLETEFDPAEADVVASMEPATTGGRS